MLKKLKHLPKHCGTIKYYYSYWSTLLLQSHISSNHLFTTKRMKKSRTNHPLKPNTKYKSPLGCSNNLGSYITPLPSSSAKKLKSKTQIADLYGARKWTFLSGNDDETYSWSPKQTWYYLRRKRKRKHQKKLYSLYQITKKNEKKHLLQTQELERKVYNEFVRFYFHLYGE